MLYTLNTIDQITRDRSIKLVTVPYPGTDTHRWTQCYWSISVPYQFTSYPEMQKVRNLHTWKKKCIRTRLDILILSSSMPTPRQKVFTPHYAPFRVVQLLYKTFFIFLQIMKIFQGGKVFTPLCICLYCIIRIRIFKGLHAFDKLGDMSICIHFFENTYSRCRILKNNKYY